MDTKHTTATWRICSILIFLCFITNHKYLAGAATLEFCQTSDYTTKNRTETGVIKSPGFGTEVRKPNDVPSQCTITITVCSGCRLRLSNTSTIDCLLTTRSCFLQRANVTLEGFPMKKVLFFNSSASFVNVTSVGRSVELLFQKSPFDAVTGQFGFYIYYKVLRPEPIRYAFDPNSSFGTISSQGFPNRYPSNEDNFRFQFESAPADYYLKLSFSDWYLSKNSKITIQSQYNILTYDYLSDRPAVVATGESILVIFDAGFGDITQNYIGFKATYTYSYGSPDASEAAEAVGIDVFDAVFGGAISFTYSGPSVSDYVWVIPKSDLVNSGQARLKLRIDSTANLRHDALEIRSGPTSEGEAVNWTIGSSLFSESGFYVRLRSGVSEKRTIAFRAVFVWTEASDGGQCHYTDLACLRVDAQPTLECLKSRDLYCDGIRHCDDGADEMECTATSKPCPSYWSCRRTLQRPICITRKCDGIRDCLDSSDETGCPASTKNPFATTTWTQSDDNLYANYSTLSITLPLVMIGIIVTIIVSFTVCIAIRRKRRLSVTRRTVHSEAPPPGPLNTDRNMHYSAHFTPNSEVVSPPPYGEIDPYNNQGFTTSPGQLAPPPYEEIAKPLAPAEPSAPPPPYLLSDESASRQPLREDGASPRQSAEQRTSPRHSGEPRTSPLHSVEPRTSPRHSGEQRTSPRHSMEQGASGSTDALISGDSQC